MGSFSVGGLVQGAAVDAENDVRSVAPVRCAGPHNFQIAGNGIARAKRWAERMVATRSPADKRRCRRQMMRALYAVMSPKPDGTHPLDAGRLTLEVV